MDYIKKVKAFHQAFKIPILNRAGFPAKSRVKLRIELMREELEEVVESMSEGDITNTLKELCDLQYVLAGTILELGLEEHFNTAFYQVHRSNMSKLCKNKKEAQATSEYYTQKGISNKIEYLGDSYAVISESGKVLKSIKYQKANVIIWEEL